MFAEIFSNSGYTVNPMFYFLQKFIQYETVSGGKFWLVLAAILKRCTAKSKFLELPISRKSNSFH